MANRWEGRDDEKSYQIAIGKYKEKKMQNIANNIASHFLNQQDFHLQVFEFY